MLDDTVDDPNEAFTVDLSSATGGATISDDTGTGTIIDNDGTPSLTIGDATAVIEGTANASAVFTVTLSPASNQQVTVAYTTSDGSATAGADYTRTEGTLTFAAGDTEETIPVPVLDDASGVPTAVTFSSGETTKSFTFTSTEDTVDEPDETVTLGFGTTLPEGVSAGTDPTAAVRVMPDFG